MPSSPRSSADAARSPTSPFLQNLSNRLRKGSITSHASSQSSEPPPASTEGPEKAESVQSTKRYLLSIVRNDWEFLESIVTDSTELPTREPVSYGVREESASDIDADVLPTVGSNSNNPYKYDNPDDIAISIQERRRKRRRLIEDELAWNEGVKFWTLQRDAWTGAVAHKPPAARAVEGNSSPTKMESPTSYVRDGSASARTTPETDQSKPGLPLPPVGESSGSSSSLETEKKASTNTELTEVELTDGPYLPIYPPLLPMSHALRSRIKPATYTTIYDKVVIQSLTPNVPIPLTHMIGALVAGWKAEGQWPPQPLDQRALAGKKGRKGDSAFAKWRREQEEKRKLTGDMTVAEKGHPNRGMRRSIGSVVKKVFGMDPDRLEASDDLLDIGLTFDNDQAPLESKQVTEENKILNKELLG